MSQPGFDPAARRRVRRKLLELPAHVEAAMKEQLAKEAADLVVEQKQLAPNRTGTLQSTIEHRDASRPNFPKQRVTAGGPATTKPVVEGEDGEYDYAFGVEFGNEHVAAQPFFYPPYRARKDGIRSRVAKAAGDAVRRAGGL